jgi:PleD family two-component response regulator
MGYACVSDDTLRSQPGPARPWPGRNAPKRQHSVTPLLARILKSAVVNRRRAVLTNSVTSSHQASSRQTVRVDAPSQKVVIVNGSVQVLGLLETVLEAGRYDIVFVESSAHAYSQIKRVQPNLVILCVGAEDMQSFHVLSMLKLDAETRNIPTLTYTTDGEGQQAEEEDPDESEPEMFAEPVQRMN